jgi:uncharacterized protein GlcG (DUF336 family)
LSLRRSVALLAAASLPMALYAPAGAEAQVLSEHNVSLAMATLIADAAIATCRADSFEATVAVVDRAGVLKLLFRADAANPHTAELVRRKAYTARTFKITTLAFERQSVAGGPLEAQRNIAEVIALGGGAPIMFGKEAVGGIGVSSSSQEEDDKCAQAGVAAASAQFH